MDLVQIGRLRKPFGVDGRLKFEIDESFEVDLSRADVIFVKRPDGQVPYFIEEVLYAEPATLKLEEVDTKEDAGKLNGSPLSLRAEDVTLSEDDNAGSFSKLAGFLLKDKKTEIGRISEVRQYPQQLMAVVLIADIEVLVPLVEELIVEIDAEARIIYCDLPDGLVAAQMA